MKALTVDPVRVYINCSIDPYVPTGLEIDKHQRDEQLIWDKKKQKNALWLADGQKDGRYMQGDDLLIELAGKPVLNACVRDYLFTDESLIPEEWGGECTIFWGTIFRRSDGNKCVPCLFRIDKRWYRSIRWLKGSFYGKNPAALRAS